MVIRLIDDVVINEGLVETLTNLLEEAKAGELQSIFYGAAWKGCRFSTGHSLSKYTDRHQFLGTAHIGLVEFQDVVRTWHDDSVLNDLIDRER